MSGEQANENQLTVYIAKAKRGQGLISKLREIGKRDDRSVNYLIVEAIREYGEKHEKG